MLFFICFACEQNAIFYLPGVPCEILSVTNDVVKCQTGEASLPPDEDDFYSGE